MNELGDILITLEEIRSRLIALPTSDSDSLAYALDDLESLISDLNNAI